MKLFRWLRYRIACLRYGWCPKHRCDKVDGGWDDPRYCVLCDEERIQRRAARLEAAKRRWYVKPY